MSPRLTAALAKVEKITAGLKDFDGDRRGHVAALGDAERAVMQVLAADEDDFDYEARKAATAAIRASVQ